MGWQTYHSQSDLAGAGPQTTEPGPERSRAGTKRKSLLCVFDPMFPGCVSAKEVPSIQNLEHEHPFRAEPRNVDPTDQSHQAAAEARKENRCHRGSFARRASCHLRRRLAAAATTAERRKRRRAAQRSRAYRPLSYLAHRSAEKRVAHGSTTSNVACKGIPRPCRRPTGTGASHLSCRWPF
jgi:hypothetical protein